jgi:hypothetical protein
MIKFARDELKDEYFNQLNAECVHILAALMDILAQDGVDAIVTCIMRTEEKQKEICEKAGLQYYASLHQYGNAVDVVPSKPLQPGQAESIARELSTEYDYGKPGKQSVLWHSLAKNVEGLGFHFHIQANPQIYGQGNKRY